MQLSLVLSTAVNAIAPIVLLILFGYWLRSKGFLSAEFVKVGSKFVFHVCLTSSLFVNVYNITDLSSICWEFIGYVIAITLVLFGLGLISALGTTKLRQRRGVVLQCVFRSNFAIIGLSLATTLGGDDAAAIASLVSAFILPLYNIMGVIALSMFADDAQSSGHHMKSVLRSIAKNPMVVGAALGLVCLLIREFQTALLGECLFSIKRDLPFFYTAINNIKSMTTPLALIVLGAQFQFSAVKGMFKEIAVGTAWRIVLAPMVGVGCAILLDKLGVISCGVGEYATLIALFGSPSAVSSAVMAGQMGGDEQLATQLVVWTSLGAVLTVFLQVCILMATGFLAV